MNVVDELTYRSYQHNRRIAPGVSPERWQKIFPDAERMEHRFQSESAFEEQIAKDLHLRQTVEQVNKMALKEKQTLEDVEAGRLAGGDDEC